MVTAASPPSAASARAAAMAAERRAACGRERRRERVRVSGVTATSPSIPQNETRVYTTVSHRREPCIPEPGVASAHAERSASRGPRARPPHRGLARPPRLPHLPAVLPRPLHGDGRAGRVPHHALALRAPEPRRARRPPSLRRAGREHVQPLRARPLAPHPPALRARGCGRARPPGRVAGRARGPPGRVRPHRHAGRAGRLRGGALRAARERGAGGALLRLRAPARRERAKRARRRRAARRLDLRGDAVGLLPPPHQRGGHDPGRALRADRLPGARSTPRPRRGGDLGLAHALDRGPRARRAAPDRGLSPLRAVAAPARGPGHRPGAHARVRPAAATRGDLRARRAEPRALGNPSRLADGGPAQSLHDAARGRALGLPGEPGREPLSLLAAPAAAAPHAAPVLARARGGVRRDRRGVPRAAALLRALRVLARALVVARPALPVRADPPADAAARAVARSAAGARRTGGALGPRRARRRDPGGARALALERCDPRHGLPGADAALGLRLPVRARAEPDP